MTERTHIVKQEVARTSEQLRKAYKALDLTVVACDNPEEFDATIKNILRPDLLVGGQNPAANSGFQMMFLPARNIAEGKPYIVVRTEDYEPGSHIRNELTHEFSNYEAERRWGEAMSAYSDRANGYVNHLQDEYYAQIYKHAGLLDKARLRFGKHPALSINTAREIYVHSIWDTPTSVPADHITIEMGYDDRLRARKKKKIEETRQVTQSESPLVRAVLLSTTLPYLAYLSFHPTNRGFERETGSELKRYLDTMGAASLLQPLNSMRETLHEISTPVDSESIFAALQSIAVTYFAFAQEHGQQQVRNYWGILRSVAEQPYSQ